MFVSGSATAYGIANVKENAEGMTVCLYDERNDGSLAKLQYGNSDACSSVRSDGTFTIYGINRDFDSSSSNVDLVVGMESISDHAYITKYNNNHDIAKGEIHRVLSLDDYHNNDRTLISNVVIESGSHDVFSRVYELNQHIELAHDKVDDYTHDIEQVIVNWDVSGSHGASYLPDDDRISLDRGQYDKPYSIYHEYGHHVMNKVYDYVPADGRDANKCKKHVPYKTELPACAWVEGFAEFFAHWVDNKATMVHQVGNTYDFENRRGLESHNAVFDDGPHVEGNIASMMWDLVDGTGENGGDDIPVSTSDFWDAFASETSPTFHIGDVLEFETQWNKFSPYSLNKVFALNTIRENTDTENPSVEITSPSNRYTSSSTSITIRGESSDNVDVASVKLYINDNLTSTLTSNLDDWSVRVTLPRNTNTIKAVAEDTSGNTSSDSIYVFYKKSGGGGGTNPAQTAPVLDSISNISINEGDTTTITARATDTNGDTIRYSLSSSPSWVSINSNSGIITINAPSELTGTRYTVTVKATDNDGSDYESFRIYINEVNQAPILSSIGSKSVTETSNLSFSVSASDSDRPSQTLRYSMSGSPTGATINSSTGAFSWTPTNSQSGTYSVTFKVTDNGSPVKSDSERISITVLDKPAPIPQSPPVLSAIRDITINEGQSKSFGVSATDVNNDSITYSLIGSPSWVTIYENAVTISAPNELTGTSYSSTVKATDNDGSDTESFTINITEINESPILSSIGNKSIQETSNLSFTLSATDSDRPANNLRYSMSNSPTGATINSNTGAFSWTPSITQSGTYNVTFTVTDNGSPTKSDSETISITVLDKSSGGGGTNQAQTAPVLNLISDVTINEGDTISFTVSATDVNGDTITYSIYNSPSWVTISGNTVTISAPTNLSDTSYSVIILAKDNDGYDSESFTININKTTNTLPILEHIPDYTGIVGDTISFTVSATDPDVPPQTLTYVTTTTVGATFDSETRVFTWTPTISQIGTHTLEFAVYDDGTPTGFDNQFVTFTITDLPNPHFVNSFGSEGTDNGEFSMPHGIAVNENGIYLADRLNDRVQIFDGTGNHIRTVGESGDGDGQFDMVTGIATSGAFVFAVDKNNNRVQVFFGSQQQLNTSFGEYGTGDGQFDGPYGIATSPSKVYVTDTGNNRVQVFATGGNFISTFGEEGSGDGQFDTPRGIDINGNRIYVTDEGNNRVQVFDLSGNYISTFGGVGSGEGQLESPFGISVNDDIIAVAERDNNRISIFDLSENFVDLFGSEGSGEGQFIKPHGVTLYDDSVYVVDTRNNRVQVFSYTP